MQDPVALTDELAWSVRKQTGCDLGVALHAIPDPASDIQNLARGQTYISATDGRNFMQRTSTMAGRGRIRPYANDAQRPSICCGQS